MNYTIKKLMVYPNEQIRWLDNIYLGMSMNNKIFHSQYSLSELLNYIGKNTDHISVLVGDYLNRYNLQISEGLNESESAVLALKESAALIDIFNNTAKLNKTNLRYDFVFTKDLRDNPSFDKRMDGFKKTYNINNNFKDLIEYTIDVFLRRQKKSKKVSEERARELCRLYLFEELVIFEILAEDGYKVNMYPGNQLPIIKAIVTGQLKDVSIPLEGIQAVEIKFRPKQIVHVQ